MDSGVLRVIPLAEAFQRVQDAGILMDVVSVLSFYINHLMIMGGAVVDESAREVVLKMLLRLMIAPRPIRMGFSVVTFIEERCMLSRSSILRELKKMRQNGVIEMHNGKLLSLKLE
ncbi:hypothetical protein F518_04183 [Serratia marcescens VGH107]|nr:hypothetical protein F518_04183 [Serratia marcescens VGH107]